MTTEERTENELMNLKVRCVNLLLNCPLNRNSRTCPFRAMRQEESVVTRVNWLKSQNLTRIMELLARHEKCLARPAIIGESPS